MQCALYTAGSSTEGDLLQESRPGKPAHRHEVEHALQLRCGLSVSCTPSKARPSDCRPEEPVFGFINTRLTLHSSSKAWEPKAGYIRPPFVER